MSRYLWLFLLVQQYVVYLVCGHTVCRNTKQCFGTELIDHDKIYCASYYSCASSTLGSNGIICGGNYGCKDATIISNDVINCVGHRACYASNLAATNNVFCDGKYACQYAQISAQNVYLYGDYGANYADIDSEDIEMINIYSTGHLSGNNVNVYCRSGSVCNVYCQNNGCMNMNYYCFEGSKCLYNCEQATHCPIMYDHSVLKNNMDIIVTTRKKQRKTYQLQQEAQLITFEEEMNISNDDDDEIQISKTNHNVNNDHDKATLESTLIIIAELLIYTLVIMIITYYCFRLRNKNKIGIDINNKYKAIQPLLMNEDYYDTDTNIAVEAYLH